MFPNDTDDADLRNTLIRKQWNRVMPTFLARNLGGLGAMDRFTYVCIPVPTA